MTKPKPFDNEMTHPSWGMISFSRVTSSGGDGNRLFGSALADHPSSIVLRIRRATRDHALSRDWFSGRGESLVEVELSPTQFAQLLTTMNVGDGVPCTIRRTAADGRVPDPPVEPLERERVQDGFTAAMAEIAQDLKAAAKEANVILTKKTAVTATDRKVLATRIAQIIQEVESNIPFALRQFNAATDKVTTAAKADIDAFVTTAVTLLGFEKLDELRAALQLAKPSVTPPPPALAQAPEGKPCPTGCARVGQPLHTCPYRVDMHNDAVTMCTCCVDCTNRCAGEV